jgi:hypothetical protein
LELYGQRIINKLAKQGDGRACFEHQNQGENTKRKPQSTQQQQVRKKVTEINTGAN